MDGIAFSGGVSPTRSLPYQWLLTFVRSKKLDECVPSTRTSAHPSDFSQYHSRRCSSPRRHITYSSANIEGIVIY